MKLYTLPGACSTAIHIVLQWTGQPFEIEIVTRGSLKRPAYLAIEPGATVPVIVHDDFLLTQNAAIMGYIADTFPQAGLLGNGEPRQRAEATRWLTFINADMHQVFGAFFAPGIYLSEPEHHAALQASAGGRLRSMYERLEVRLEDREWIAGFRSVADAYLYIMLRWADRFHLNMHGLPRLAAFKQRMENDRGVRMALISEGLN